MRSILLEHARLHALCGLFVALVGAGASHAPTQLRGTRAAAIARHISSATRLPPLRDDCLASRLSPLRDEVDSEAASPDDREAETGLPAAEFTEDSDNCPYADAPYERNTWGTWKDPHPDKAAAPARRRSD